MLASVVKHMDCVVYENIAMYLNGTLNGGNIVIGLRECATKLVFNLRFASTKKDILAWEGKAGQAETRFPAG